MMTLRLSVAVSGVVVPVEVHHKETIANITRRALATLYGHEAPAIEHCQMLLGEEALDMGSRVDEIELDTGVQLNLVIPF